MLRAALRNPGSFYAVTFEFEPNNQIFLFIITKWGMWLMSNSPRGSMVWWLLIILLRTLDTNNIDTGGFILNSLLHLVGNWCLSLFGVFFNLPIALGEKGSTVRFEKKGGLFNSIYYQIHK